MLLGVSGLYVTVAGMLLWTPLTCTRAWQGAHSTVAAKNQQSATPRARTAQRKT